MQTEDGRACLKLWAAEIKLERVSELLLVVLYQVSYLCDLLLTERQRLGFPRRKRLTCTQAYLTTRKISTRMTSTRTEEELYPRNVFQRGVDERRHLRRGERGSIAVRF